MSESRRAVGFPAKPTWTPSMKRIYGLVFRRKAGWTKLDDSAPTKKSAPFASPPDSPASDKLGAHRPEPLQRALAAKAHPSSRSTLSTESSCGRFSTGRRVSAISVTPSGASAASSGALSLEAVTPAPRPECCSPRRASARCAPEGWERFEEAGEDGRASGAWGRPASPDLKLVWSVDEEGEEEGVDAIDLADAPRRAGAAARPRREWEDSWANAVHDEREEERSDGEEEEDEDEDSYLDDPARYVGYERWESEDGEMPGGVSGADADRCGQLPAVWNSNLIGASRGSEPSFAFRAAGPGPHYAMPDAPSYAAWESGSSGHLIATRGRLGLAIARSLTEQNGLLTDGTAATGGAKPLRTSSADGVESPRPEDSHNAFDDSADETRHHSPLSEASTVFGRERFLTEDYEIFQSSPLSEASA